MQANDGHRLQLSPAGYVFINSPTRTQDGSPDGTFWRTVTEIYVRIHGQIIDMIQLLDETGFDQLDASAQQSLNEE